MSNRIAITGTGAVSPAGWGTPALVDALRVGEPLPAEPFAHGLRRRAVPKPAEKLPFLRHPRLRRGSPVARYLAAAATEAMGGRTIGRLAVVVSCYTGSVNYSSRFFSEVLDDPGTASPILFPETVFNAPSSHLSALFGSDLVNHTLVGDESALASALDIAARWLIDSEADAVLVAAGEESDPLTADALGLRDRSATVGEGAGALVLEKIPAGGVELAGVGDPITYRRSLPRTKAIGELGEVDHAAAERIPEVCGDCFGATPALALVAAVATMEPGRHLALPVIGKNLAAAKVELRG